MLSRLEFDNGHGDNAVPFCATGTHIFGNIDIRGIMEIKHDIVELNTDSLDAQKAAAKQETRREWIEPRLERRGDLSSATGFFGGFSP